MLSYRHAFHAGNHADVLKHLVLVQSLELLCTKDKPLWYVDTHAGAGRYALGAGLAQGHAEHEEGIGRLWQAEALPAPLARYRQLVRTLNGRGRLRSYPGSPLLANAVLRPQDRLWLHERHPADAVALAKEFRPQGARVRVIDGDGFAGLRALLPPTPRRALVMIDPSYEVREDYRAVIAALREGMERFATGVYLLWYPLLARHDSRELQARFREFESARWLHARLAVRGADANAGLYGSGMFVLNPPWQLHEALAACGDSLATLLATAPGQGRFELTTGKNS